MYNNVFNALQCAMTLVWINNWLKIILDSWIFTRHVDEVGWRRFGNSDRFHLHRSSKTYVIILNNWTIMFVSLDLWRWERPGMPKRRQPAPSTRRGKTREPRNTIRITVTIWRQLNSWFTWRTLCWFPTAAVCNPQPAMRSYDRIWFFEKHNFK